MKKFIKICEIFLFLFFLVLLFFTKQKLATLLIIPLLVILYFIYKKESIKHWEVFLFIIAFFIRIVSIFFLNVEIADDFKTMYEASLSLLKGNLDFMNGFYFRTYPFQLGLTLYQAVLLKIYHDVIILKIFNSIYTSFIIVYLYKISKLFVKEKIARMVSFSYLFYLYPLYLNSVLTNQHIPAFLMLIAIYFVITKMDSIKSAFWVAIILGVANFFRTESIIMIMAIVIFKFVFITRQTVKKTLLYLFIVLVSYFSFTTMTNQIIMHSPLNTAVSEEAKLDKNVTLWKFYCGLSTKHNGIYNEEDQNMYFNTDQEKELLMERIKNDKFRFPVLFLKKEVILWTQTNYDLRILNPFQGFWYSLVLSFNQGYLNFVMLLFVISLIPKKEEERKEVLFIKLLIGLYFGIYLFIEISPRYAYNLHMLVFLLLGIGVERIIDFYHKKVKKTN